eukprot:GDKJ01059085.1.p1 GENE.GDKJ01059085.1~~GDKJ01059085.1.p1  ORF type:complete len:397 (+),score=36.54 GDKJ01059085.1:83-1192(+)
MRNMKGYDLVPPDESIPWLTPIVQISSIVFEFKRRARVSGRGLPKGLTKQKSSAHKSCAENRHTSLPEVSKVESTGKKTLADAAEVAKKEVLKSTSAPMEIIHKEARVEEARQVDTVTKEYPVDAKKDAPLVEIIRATEPLKFYFMMKETLSGNPKKSFMKMPEGSLVMDLMVTMKGYTLVSPAQPPPETPLNQISQDFKSPDIFVFIKSTSLKAAEQKTLEAELAEKIRTATFTPVVDQQKDSLAEALPRSAFGEVDPSVVSPVMTRNAVEASAGPTFENQKNNAQKKNPESVRFNFKLKKKPDSEPSDEYMMLPKGSTLLNVMRNMKGCDLIFPKESPSLSTPIVQISREYDSPDIFIFAKRIVERR